MRNAFAVQLASALTVQHAIAVTLDVESEDSIKQAAKTVAAGMMNYYHGNEFGMTPGLLPSPHYWWQTGAMFGGLIDYWYYTGDTTYNDVTTQAMLWQVGPKDDYMPPNQTKTEGNDDQAFWGMAAMSAAENNFPNPPAEKPQWLALAQAVFNLQASRWDSATCGGGLRWQIFPFNNGYDYKNSISEGSFFNIAARLGAYTQNNTYFDWAEKMWDWTEGVHLIGDNHEVYDGTDVKKNCSDQNLLEWSYNNGVFLLGAAVMWNQTNGTRQDLWRTRVAAMMDRQKIFFAGDDNMTMYEQACEPQMNCNTDQLSFKAYLSRWMAATTKFAPWTASELMPYLKASATAAAQTCVGGTDGQTCGTKWTVSGWDGTYGVGQQMSVLETIQANLAPYAAGPFSNRTGGTSVGDSNAGAGGDENPTYQRPITTGDKAGAGILTGLLLIATISGGWWLVS